jgi:diadenosine tetraphosphate (Ap4A) HIT family hydrolase
VVAVLIPPCPFCTLPPRRIVAANEAGWIVRDAYPVTNGHTLVIPRRHISSFFELTVNERQKLLELLDIARAELDVELNPQG